MPPRAKKAAAHDRANTNHNHSLGLAAPGRPIPKSKSSNPNLNAQHTNAPSRKSTPDSPLSPLDSSVFTCPTLANGTAVEIADPAAQMYPMCRTRVASASAENDVDPHSLLKFKHTAPLRIDVNTQGAPKLPRQQKSRMSMATTILTSCPLWDVVAILIVLLQLPPTIITIIHFLFAMITFVPSSATTSLSNLPTIHEILVGSAGSPSIQTIIMVDLLMFLLFIPLWTPAQNVALDLAQAVIAISLGGAAASKGGTTNSVFWCVVLIILSHIMRWRSVRQLGVNLVWSGLIRYGFQPQGRPPKLSEYSDRLYTTPAWPRCILGVHILAQGVLRMVRRYLLWRQAQVDVVPAKHKSDSDYTSQSPASGTPRSSSISLIPNSEAGLNASSDGRPPGPPPVKDRSTGTKKKRKLSQHARMQQPFWAALAHTKVTVSKEYEQTQISQDAKVAGSVDAKSIGNTDFKGLQKRVWIREIEACDISFGVCLPLNQEIGDVKEEENISKESEPSNWYVKVNGASWMSIKRVFFEKIMDGEDEYETWEGRIYGLTPMASYHLEFVKESDHSLIYDTTLITQRAPSTETSGYMHRMNQHNTNTYPAAIISSPAQTLQPSSPTTTLKNSILAAEVECEKLKNTSRTARKSHKVALDRLQSQIDSAKGKLSTTGGNDERQKQRVKQLDTSILKLKLEQEEAEQSLSDLGPIPLDEKQQYERAKNEARDRHKRLDVQKSKAAKSKKEAGKKVSTASNELQSILNKRGKMQGKQKDKAAQLVDVGKKKDLAAQANSLRHQEKLNQETRRRQELHDFESQVAELDKQYQQEIKSHNTIAQQTSQYEELCRRIQSGNSAPGTPEGGHASIPALPSTTSAMISGNLGSTSLPGSRPSSLHVHSGFTPGFQFPAPIGSGLSMHGRKRSSSLETEMTNYYNGFYPPTSMAAPPGLSSSFSPASSSALLANSTALAPPVSHAGTTPFPNFANGFHHVPAPVGAEKESRRKGSAGSHGSFKGVNGITTHSENGSPHFGKLTSTTNTLETTAPAVNGLHHVGKLGLVSPPSSAIWDRKGLS
jgi:hypothetical protein